MAYTIIASFRIKEGKLEKAIQLLKNHAEWIKNNEPGTIHYFVHKLRGENMMILYERYKNDAAFNTHRKNLERVKDLTPLIEGETDIKILEDV